MDELKLLADLIKQKNKIEKEIGKIIDRPAIIGHVGEYIASKVFDIRLENSASTKGLDGYFEEGILKGKSVNIKFYTKNERLLDITPNFLPDYYLVLTGDVGLNTSSKGTVKPWCISSVYFFESKDLIERLKKRNVKIGTATSVNKSFWEEVEVYPIATNTTYHLSEKQKDVLKLFALD
jgi:hypothetical protein